MCVCVFVNLDGLQLALLVYIDTLFRRVRRRRFRCCRGLFCFVLFRKLVEQGHGCGEQESRVELGTAPPPAVMHSERYIAYFVVVRGIGAAAGTRRHAPIHACVRRLIAKVLTELPSNQAQLLFLLKAAFSKK